jgi:hypothetical protein
VPPASVRRFDVALHVLIFDVGDVVSLRGERCRGCSHPERLSSGSFDFSFRAIVSQAPARFTLFPSAVRLTPRTLALEVSNGR